MAITDPLAITDKQTMRNIKLSFARVGIFNPIVHEEWTKDVTQWIAGKRPQRDQFWWVDPESMSIQTNIIKSLRRKYTVKNNANWSVREQEGPIQLTQHALARYRERVGKFLTHDDIWNATDYRPDSFMERDLRMAKDYMLPFGNGAFLGYDVIGPSLFAGRYKMRKFKKDQEEAINRRFRAFTYITRDQMFDWQRAICDAVNNGDYDLAKSINADHAGEIDWQDNDNRSVRFINSLEDY